MTNTPHHSAAPSIATLVRDFYGRFVVLPTDEQMDLLALYTIHTYAADCAKVTPYIYINSAERGSGKSTLLEVMMAACARSLNAQNATAPVVFAAVEHHSPTLFQDEVDAIWAGAKNDELRGLLNSGYKRGNTVLRRVGSPTDENGGLMEFATFCPKVLAGIDNGNMPETIEDRSITLTLKRATAEQMANVEEYYADDFEDELIEITRAIEAWVNKNRDRIRQSKENTPAPIDGLRPRQNEICRPLLLIAAALGREWNERARIALKALLSREEKLSPQSVALMAVRDWFRRNADQDKITSAMVTEITGQNGKQIGVWFNAYDITPGTYRIAGKNAKGYRRTDFTDAFTRYLPVED